MIARSGSINEAAKQLFISQPSLSETIRELESEVGLTFFCDPTVELPLHRREKNFKPCWSGDGSSLDCWNPNTLTRRPVRNSVFPLSIILFAVKAFVETVKQFGMEQYEFAMHETTTASVIENVKDFKSEIGVLCEK